MVTFWLSFTKYHENLFFLAAVGESTLYNDLYAIKNELQSVQMKCGHVILFLEPAVSGS